MVREPKKAHTHRSAGAGRANRRANEALTNMSSGIKHKWTFRARFRRNAFGWRSQPAIKRIKEAVSEIKKAARKDPVLGGEGGVLFLEKISAAIERVDGSSGAIGTTVYNAIEALAPMARGLPPSGPETESSNGSGYKAEADPFRFR
jgi:hypothetical protein